MTAFSAQHAEGWGHGDAGYCPMPTHPFHSINTLHSSYPAPPPIPKQVGCLRKWYFYFRRNTEFLMLHTEFCEVSRNSAAFHCKILRNFCKIISTFLHVRANEKKKHFRLNPGCLSLTAYVWQWGLVASVFTANCLVHGESLQKIATSSNGKFSLMPCVFCLVL